MAGPLYDILPAGDAGSDELLGRFLDYVFLTPDGRGYLDNYFRTLSDLFLVEGLRLARADTIRGA